MGAVGILTSAVLILVDKSINLSGKKRMLRINLLDYLENFCKVRLEQEAFQPEIIEQYRREFLQAAEANKQISAASTVRQEKDEPKDELNRRREARRLKEEERKLQAVKREEEQRRIEEARKEDEKKKIEERRQLAAKRREEERQKLEEEREALEARRAELKKKVEEKQIIGDKKPKDSAEKEIVLHSKEEEPKPIEKTYEKEPLKKADQELTDKKEKVEIVNSENSPDETVTENKETVQTVPLNKDKSKKPVVTKFQGVTPQEEKLIEDVLKEFFA
jgi:hypothetical protein